MNIFFLLWLPFACSDPTLEDSDGDGFSNAQELEAQTNPNSKWSYPLEYGNYNIGYCDIINPSPTGKSEQTSISEGDMELSWEHYAVGDVVDNIVLKDQYGQDVPLYSFCGQHIMLVTASFT